MPVETVKVYVVDQGNHPVRGVLVRVFDADGAVFIDQNYTVSEVHTGRAVADFTLDGNDPPISYTIRLSKVGVAFDGNQGRASKSPQLITVYSPPASAPNGTNYFQVVGQTFTRPVSPNPRMCRASGFFLDPVGRPLPGLVISLINQFDPTLIDGNVILGAKVGVQTDANGYVEVDLFRNGIYRAMVESVEAPEANDEGSIVFERKITVPDLPSINFPDLLFPTVVGITWTPGVLMVGVGETLDVYPLVLCSDQNMLVGSGFEDIIYDTDDHNVAVVSSLPDRVTIAGVGSGVCNLTATRKDQTVVSIPAAPISGQPMPIAVT